MKTVYRHHDISDKIWELLEANLPGRKGTWGGNARNNRQFLNAVFWILRTGAPWRDLPPDYGDWKNAHRRFCRWRDKGFWEKLLEKLLDEPDFEWLILDVSQIKIHPHAAGAQRGNQALVHTKRDSARRCTWPWMRMLCRSESLLQAVPQLIMYKLVSSRHISGASPLG